jgi:hypothetical protein
MTSDNVVFIGPSLSLAEASSYLDARFLPPAEQGSVFRVVRAAKPRAIVLIDGIFAKVPAVRHKEILWALSRRVPVYGAASIGALRAAELAPFGMRGHGLIYRWYRATPLADDDEVAVAMTPPEVGAQALSDALVNIRRTLQRAAAAGIISIEVRRALEAVARSLHFTRRTYSGVFDEARTILPASWQPQIEAVACWAADHAVDQKKADASALLRWLSDQVDLPPVETSALEQFRMTEAWGADLDASGLYSVDPLQP